MILACDAPDPLIRTRVGSGSWVRVRRGAFVAESDEADEPEPFARLTRQALARIAAVDRQLRAPHVISHQSAALLWGLPYVDDGTRVHVVQRSAPHRRGAADVVRHHHELASGDVVTLAGVRVTTLERTVLDCAMSLSAQDGLVLADAAMRRGLEQASCLARLGTWAGRRGLRTAIAVLELADDGAESPGESRLRHVVLRAGFPPPQTQVRVPTPEGDAWADIGWPEWRVLAEYDGRAKYTADGSAADAVLRERRREVLLEREGWRVVRATGADLARPASLVTAILRHCPAGTASRLQPRPWLT